MKATFYLILLLLSNNLFSQVIEQPNLNITGSARVNVTPDVGVLNIHVSNISPKMTDAVNKLGDKSSYYTNILKRLNFKENEIKTTSFSVSKNTVYRNNEYVDSGFVASQNIRVEFKYDEQILSKILNAFTKENQEVDFSFDFKLSEILKAKVQKQIIDLAIIDAKEKSKNISEASGLKLGKIKNISYGGWGGESGMTEIEREQKYDASAAMAGDAYRVYNFTPDDLVFRDTILIEWIIE